MKYQRMTALGILTGFFLTLFFYALLYWEIVRDVSLAALLASLIGGTVWSLLWSLGVVSQWVKEIYQERTRRRTAKFLNNWWGR